MKGIINRLDCPVPKAEQRQIANRWCWYRPSENREKPLPGQVKSTRACY